MEIGALSGSAELRKEVSIVCRLTERGVSRPLFQRFGNTLDG